MKNPGTAKGILDGGLWHATGKIAIVGIIASGVIPVSESDRYRSSFCRKLGGVSVSLISARLRSMT